MSRLLRVAMTQMSMAEDRAVNIACAADLVRQAHAQGAQVVLLPELFETHYFCREMKREFFALATTLAENPAVKALAPLAKELGVVLPVSFFERASDSKGDTFYNSIAMLDADGTLMGVYRKSHIPDGTGYEEKFYFTPGNTGFKVWNTHYGKLGVGICWDQWFPECARAMTLMGADVLMYPTAIGSEPNLTGLDTRKPWRRVMIGHAVANTTPVLASNRVGTEGGQSYYGSAFVCDEYGEIITELNRTEEGVAVATLDLDHIAEQRKFMCLLTDRRPELYGKLTE